MEPHNTPGYGYNIPTSIARLAEKLGLELHATGGHMDYVRRVFTNLEVWVVDEEGGDMVESLSEKGSLRFAVRDDDEQSAEEYVAGFDLLVGYREYKDYSTVRAAMAALAKMTDEKCEAIFSAAWKIMADEHLPAEAGWQRILAHQRLKSASASLGEAKVALQGARQRMATARQLLK